MSVRTPTLDETAMRAPSWPDHTHTLLWAGAVLTFGVGDAALTAAGLSLGATEANPVVADVVATHGAVGIVAVKIAALAAFAGFYRVIGRPSNVGVPAGLLALGAAATAWNAAIILEVVA